MATSIFTFLCPNNKKSRQHSLHPEALHLPLLLCNSQLGWDQLGGCVWCVLIIWGFLIIEALLGHPLDALKNRGGNSWCRRASWGPWFQHRGNSVADAVSPSKFLNQAPSTKQVFICLSRLTATCSVLRKPGLQEALLSMHLLQHAKDSCNSGRFYSMATLFYFHEVQTWQLQEQNHQELG